jgi:hypothetical protein
MESRYRVIVKRTYEDKDEVILIGSKKDCELACKILNEHYTYAPWARVSLEEIENNASYETVESLITDYRYDYVTLAKDGYIKPIDSVVPISLKEYQADGRSKYTKEKYEEFIKNNTTSEKQ